MPIKIRSGPEPLSPASLRPGAQSFLIGSAQSDFLIRELRRYCWQQTTGRSVLIAGHRGSGKTTLVQDALVRLVRESDTAAAPPDPSPTVADTPLRAFRPLLVPLLGPNLLPTPDEAAAVVPAVITNQKLEAARQAAQVAADVAKASKKAEAGTAPADSTPAQTEPPRLPDASRKVEDAQNTLIQMVLGMHRAVAREVTRAARDRLREARALSPQIDELYEMAAQLEIELDDDPSPARLREFYHRMGFVRPGLLFPSRSDGTPVAPDQGLRELVALSTVCEAFSRISGSMTVKSVEAGVDARKQSAAADVVAAGKDLLAPVVALLAGGATGTAVAAAHAGTAAALIAGVVAAIAATFTFKLSSSRSADRTVTRDRQLVRDLTVSTLDRIVPVLIGRLADAGLAPIFVVDELDKVADGRRIDDLVNRLKKLVAENAFFCFLADRSYFERLEEQDASGYGTGYTVFSQKLFVTHRPSDFHAYLNAVLERPAPPHRNPPADAPVPDAESSADDDAAADYPLLSYVLLHQSQMHAIDLRRRLDGLRRPDGSLSLPPGRVRSRASYQFDLYVQLGIEIVLRNDTLGPELDRDPTYARLAHDAMYYPTRQWHDRVRELDLSDGAFDDFWKYLDARADGSPVPRAGHVVRRAQAEQLHGEVRKLAVLLSDPVAFRDAFALFSERRYDGGGAPSTSERTAIGLKHIRDALPLGGTDPFPPPVAAPVPSSAAPGPSAVTAPQPGRPRFDELYVRVVPPGREAWDVPLGPANPWLRRDDLDAASFDLWLEDMGRDGGGDRDFLDVGLGVRDRGDGTSTVELLARPGGKYSAYTSHLCAPGPSGPTTLFADVYKLGARAGDKTSVIGPWRSPAPAAPPAGGPGTPPPQVGSAEPPPPAAAPISVRSTRTEPPLRSHGGGRYSWRCEPSGWAWPPGRLSADAGAAGGAPRGAAPPPMPEWRQSAAFIGEVANAVEQLGRPTFNLTQFAATWSILPGTPAWTEVANSIKRLARFVTADQTYEGMPDDVDAVTRFAGVLLSGERRLTRAIQAASLIGGMAGDGPAGRRIGIGMWALTDAYGLAGRPEGEVEALLAEVRSESLDVLHFGGPTAGLDPLLHDRALADTPGAWERFGRQAAEALQRLPSLPDAQRPAAFDEVDRHWAECVFRTAATRGDLAALIVPPTTRTLVAHACGYTLGNDVKHRLAATPVRAWSAAAVRAIADGDRARPSRAPQWMPVVALVALGFAARLRELWGRVEQFGRLAPEESARARDWLFAPPPEPARETLLVIAVDGGESIVSALHTDEAVAAIILTRSEWTGLTNLFGPLPSAAPDPSGPPLFKRVAIEVGPGDDDGAAAARLIEEVRARIGAAVAVSILSTRVPPGLQGHHIVLSPQSLRAFVPGTESAR